MSDSRKKKKIPDADDDWTGIYGLIFVVFTSADAVNTEERHAENGVII